MYLRAGNLDQRITIQSAVETQTAYGSYTVAYDTLDTVWAEVLPQMDRSSTEQFEGDRLTAVALYKFRIRYRTDLNERMRILWRSRYFYIRSIHELMRDVGLEIMAERKDSELDHT